MSGVPTLIGGYFFKLASNSPMIFIIGSATHEFWAPTSRSSFKSVRRLTSFGTGSFSGGRTFSSMLRGVRRKRLSPGPQMPRVRKRVRLQGGLSLCHFYGCIHSMFVCSEAREVGPRRVRIFLERFLVFLDCFERG